MIRLKSLKTNGIKNLDVPSEQQKKLEFPAEGKIFIYGSNEAGKSTLFEAIFFALFGQSLVPDRSKASMSELLAYDRKKGRVELEFTIGDTLYHIRRTITERGSRHDYTHQMVIQPPRGKPESVKGARQVNKRVEQELGLDGDALLNSCFVEQKNLDRLENSSRSAREAAISNLLNLDRFTRMEGRYDSQLKNTKEALERAKKKLQLAEIEEQKIPQKEQELKRVEQKLQVIKWKKQIQELKEDIAEYKSQIKQREEDIEELETELKEIEQLEKKLPDKQERLSRLDDLYNEFNALEELQATIEKLTDYQAKLKEWGRLKKVIKEEKRIAREEEEYKQKKKEVTSRIEVLTAEKVTEFLKQLASFGGGITATLLAVVGVLSSLLWLIPIGLIGAGLLFIAGGKFTLQWKKVKKDIQGAKEEKDAHEDKLSELRGERKSLIQREGEKPEKQLHAVEKAIRKLGYTVPKMEEYDEEPLKKWKKKIEENITEENTKKEAQERKITDKAEALEVTAEKARVNSVKSQLSITIKNHSKKIEEKPSVEQRLLEKNDQLKEQTEKKEEAEESVKEYETKIKAAPFQPTIEEKKKLGGVRDTLIGSLNTLRRDKNQLREELGIEEALEVAIVKKEVEETNARVKLFEYAGHIVSRAKNNIISSVLPRTEKNMARFLPILTAGRYKDAKIDPDSYTIRVYDSRAQTYKDKKIFSGGTKDQVSLALRLSFAMATLPQERGTAPDFLFLDEPVGSFDDERQEALVELLTRGEIAETFNQIFVVSHVGELKEEFSRYIKMEDGQIVDKSL